MLTLFSWVYAIRYVSMQILPCQPRKTTKNTEWNGMPGMAWARNGSPSYPSPTVREHRLETDNSRFEISQNEQQTTNINNKQQNTHLWYVPNVDGSPIVECRMSNVRGRRDHDRRPTPVGSVGYGMVWMI